MGPFNLSIRLAAIGAVFTVAVGWPVSAASFDPQKQALQCVLSAIGGGLFPVTLATARLYLGWQYIGARLSSATVEYEETGWYDGQVWVKTPELLARDRLLASYRVKPVLKNLQNILTGLGSSLLIIAGLVAFLPSYTPKPEARPFYFDDAEVESPYFVNIVTAEEKSYDPDAAEVYEDEALGEERWEEARTRLGEAEDSRMSELYRRMHSGPLSGEETSSSFSPGGEISFAVAATYHAQGFGFEYLVAEQSRPYTLDAEEDELFSRSSAKGVAQDLRGQADVTIIAYKRKVVYNSEVSFTPVDGTEDLTIVGAGVSSAPAASTKVRISDHLGTGGDGRLQVVKSLRPETEILP